MQQSSKCAAGVCLAAVITGLTLNSRAESPKPVAATDPTIETGRRLIKIAGCNDCHTPGYAMSNGTIPEANWLTGDSLGWRGPWGTTYPSNLRNLAQGLSEDGWLEYLQKAPMRPPMPAYVFKDLTEQEKRAMYRFIRSLGAAGQPAPAYVPPDKEPSTPVVQWPAPPPGK